MLVVRGIMENLKLNPAIKLWGGFAILAALLVAGLTARLVDFDDRAEACEEQGGTWVGGRVPVRIAIARSISGHCAKLTEKEKDW